jgi:hypothetical protein
LSGVTYEDATCDKPEKAICEPVDACRCKDGYVRFEGKCIKPCDCPAKCNDPNEIFVKGATYEDPTCDNPKKKKCKSVNACRCKKGYVRNKGVCIKQCDCPSCKGKNEIWVNGATYEDATCKEPKQKTCQATDGCRCKKGFVRFNGECIKACDCPSCKGKNEVWVYGATYEDATCDEPQQKTCEAVDGCRCKKGYVRYKGECVKKCDCPSCSGKNEIWVVGATYEDATCDEPKQKTCKSVDACRCKNGYVRYKGECIKQCDCPSCGKNEIWVIGATYEDATCDNPKQKTCDAVDGCRCKKGYVRYKGECIKKGDCPSCKCKNEIWVIGATYEDATCDEPKQKTCQAVDGCRCKKGYVRYKGECIKKCDCPSCKGKNEIWVVGANYEDATCDDPSQKTCGEVDACRCKTGYVRYKGECIKACDCPTCSGQNEIWVIDANYEDPTCDNPKKNTCKPVDGCRCKSGYVRYKGQCIKDCDCPSCNGKNEIWVIGANYVDATCSEPEQKTCEPVDGCRCKKGYIRYKGECIKECDCPSCKGENEIWVIGATYEDATCADPQKKTCEVTDGCRCKTGYVRYKGECIKECDCPTCKGENEIWVIDANYEDGTCEDPTQPSCGIVDACRCKNGYVRYKGKCIKACDCPSCKGKNEIWVIGATYEDATCTDPSQKTCEEVDACRCKNGYVRYKGECIKSCDCPSCSGKNEIWVIDATYVDATCENPTQKSCSPIDGCRCKVGYVRYKGKCIKSCNCPSCKGPNEVWILGATYEDATCDAPKQKTCAAENACRCKEGYVRYKGDCIKQCDCPNCKGKNEIWVIESTYEDATCDSPKQKTCKAVDICRCKKGYVRYKGECIKACDCPSCQGANEIWVIGATYNDGTCKEPKQNTCDATDGCRCKKGFVRFKGKCIMRCDCPKCQGENEVFVEGATYLDATCENPKQDTCDAVDDCRCKPGYVRYDGVCIKPCGCRK